MYPHKVLKIPIMLKDIFQSYIFSISCFKVSSIVILQHRVVQQSVPIFCTRKQKKNRSSLLINLTLVMFNIYTSFMYSFTYIICTM